MISIVVPLFNEEESLPQTYERIRQSLAKLKIPHEIIFVDDGSIDNSLNFLKELKKRDKNIKILSFRRNQGKAEALTLGFQQSQGDYVVTLDADLQDRPEEIESLYKKIKEGYDLVSGWRKNRKDTAKLVIASKLFNSLAKIFWGLNLHDYNCGLKIYTKEAAKNLRLYGGMHRFIPLLCFENGFSVTEIPVIHDARKFGKSKYGFSKLWKDVPDMFTALFLMRYARRPLHFFGLIGGILILVGLIILVYLWIQQLHGATIGRRPLLLVGFFMLISGLQVFFTGFLADLMLHNHEQAKYQNGSDPRIKYISE